MEPNRININGTWYVQEDTEETNPIELDYTFTESCTVETDKYCYEASRHRKDDGTYYDDVYIKVTIKKGNREEWVTDYWDHQRWLIGILEKNPESIPEFEEAVPEKDEQEIFITVLQKLVEIDWLKQNNYDE